MTQELTFLIADDHLLFLEGLKMIVETNPNYRVVATATNGEEVFVKLSSHYVDIVLIDINMPKLDGLQTTKNLKDKYPEISVICVSSHLEKVMIERMYQFGASAYLSKNLNLVELMIAIKKAALKERYYSPEILKLLFEKKTTQSRVYPNISQFNLTKRELDVLLLIGEEYTTPQIANKLSISPHTVISHRKNLLQKLNVRNTAGLVKYALDVKAKE